MSKVAPIGQRKADHIRIALEQDVRSGLTNGLEKIHLIHEALPEIDLESVDTTVTVFGKTLKVPLIISSMTGGAIESKTINQRLAEAAQETGVSLGVGSQRAALENPNLAKTYSVTRNSAPDILLFANLGAIQLNYGYTIDECRRAVDMIRGNALILHLNSIQEALQQGGNVNFSGLANNIEKICRKIEVPVIVKEVGWGISERTAAILAGCGVSAIDVSGAGGTSWSQVEMHRAPDDFARQLAATFVDWGIPTANSITNVKRAAPGMQIFASGGLRNGLDISKSIALGATLGGMAAPFLKTAAVSAEMTVDLINLIKKQIMVTMFACGSRTLDALRDGKLVFE